MLAERAPDRIAEDMTGQVISEAGSIEIVAHANKKASGAFLINHVGEQLTDRAESWDWTFTPVPPIRAAVRIRDREGRMPGSVSVAHRPTEWKARHSFVEVPLTMDTLWKVLQVNWQR